MRFGPTSLRLASVLARGLHRPCLRPDLKVSEQVVAGESSYVIKIPETNAYARFGEYEYTLLKLCDGTRTPAEITAHMSQQYPDRELSEEEVAEFLDGMDPHTWERSLGEKNLAILEKIRQERRSRVDQSSLLYIYFSAWDPDKLLTRIHPYLRWMFTRGFVLFSLLLFVLTLVIVAADFARIRGDTGDFYSFTNKTAYDLWIFWFLIFVISGIHEFGHGLACKHFGGEVHQMGFILVYFSPSFYTDCTDMHMFDRTSKRLWTIFAGLWIEMVVCGFSTLFWFFSLPGSFWGDLAYKMLLLTGVSGLFLNLNPLMKFDGYFALAQYLEMDNLREDSFAYLKAWLRRTLLRQDVALPPANRRRRRILLSFGFAASVYSVLILTLVTVFVKNVFTSKFGNWGYLLTAGIVYLLLRKRLRKLRPQAISAGLRAAKEKFMAWRATRLQLTGGTALLALLVFLPTPTQVVTEFVLEPGERAEVRAPVPGLVAEVRVRDGDGVAAGSVLAVLRNPEMETRVAVRELELEIANRSLAAARARGELGEMAKHTREQTRLQQELAEAIRQRDALLLRAPMAGVVATPRLEQRAGEYLDKGAQLAVLANRQEMRARVLVRDWELEDVKLGDPVKLKVRAHPYHTFTGHVQQILPAAALDRPVAEPLKVERKGQELTNYFAVILEFPNPEGRLSEGMTGTAKISGRSYSMAWRGLRSAGRWFLSQVW